MRRFKKITSRVIIALVFVCAVVGISVSKVSAGYMYSSDGQLINCSDGFSITNNGIYDILSDAWAGLRQEEGATSFNSPADLALFTDPTTGEETIYIVDSASNKLFIFDGNLNYKRTISSFTINLLSTNRQKPWTEDDVEVIYTRSSDGKTSVKLWNPETNFNNYRIKEKTLSINLFGVSGVYRALRPLKDENNRNILDENENMIYQDILYICDTKNKQVLLCDVEHDYEVIQVISTPTGYSFSDKFQPSKITTDSTGRMFIISEGIYEGILLMSYQGSFMRMVGVNYTTLSVWDALKRNFKTEEQLAQETTILQTSFTNLCIDDMGFIYTTSGPVTNADGTVSKDAMIKRINQSNADVLKRTGHSKPVGDLIVRNTGKGAGASSFVAITVNKYGVYTVADSRNNRLFTYDEAGNLLYISGGSGSQVTNISIPVAITYQGENILLLDKGNKCVMRFEPTEFASKINTAVQYEYVGDAISAADQWQDVINSNPQYELAYVGVGKKLYEERRYQEAMLYFEKGADVKYYSRAYKAYRDEVINRVFPTAVTIALILIAGGIVFKIVKKQRSKRAGEEDEL